jgi:flagellar protein FliS
VHRNGEIACPNSASALVMNAKSKLYGQVAVRGALEDAPPHRVRQLAYRALLDALGAARCAMDRRDVPAKGNQLSYAIELLGALLEELDPEASALEGQMHDLYHYLVRQILLANLENDRSVLNECLDLLTPIARAWDESASPPPAQRLEEGGRNRWPSVASAPPRRAPRERYQQIESSRS